MTRVLSLLRGINVSGQKKISMANLKSHYETLGFQNVKTYIQSGNVLFTPQENQSKAVLQKRIKDMLAGLYGFNVDVQVKMQDEWKDLIRNCPFLFTDTTKLYVTFLAKIPSQRDIDICQGYVKEPEKLILEKDIVYLYCPNGYGRSKLTTTFLESKLGISATTRNWRTVEALNNLF